jgi:hypothetical protein
MGKPSRGRLSTRDRIAQRNSWHRAAAALCADPERRAAYESSFLQDLPPKRERVVRPVDRKPQAPLEKEIQAAILQALRLRRDVVFVGRFNSGQARETNANGEHRYIWFNTVPGFPDIHGLLVGGKAFYIEVKRPHPNYEKPSVTQQTFLDQARVGGAYTGVATSVEEALALLP